MLPSKFNVNRRSTRTQIRPDHTWIGGLTGATGAQEASSPARNIPVNHQTTGRITSCGNILGRTGVIEEALERWRVSTSILRPAGDATAVHYTARHVMADVHGKDWTATRHWKRESWCCLVSIRGRVIITSAQLPLVVFTPTRNRPVVKQSTGEEHACFNRHGWSSK